MAMTQDYLGQLNERVGIAPANSQEEYQAAQTISSMMEEYDVDPSIEEFDAHVFSALLPSVLSVLMLVGMLLGGMGLGVVSAIGVVVALIPTVIFVLRFLGRDVTFSFGPRVRSQNVVGVHRACGPMVTKGSRTIVVVAHYDTPHENFLYSSPVAPYLPLLSRCARLSVLAVGFCAFFQLLGFVPAPARIFFWIVGLLCSVPSVVLAAGAISERFSPCTLGANDNKAAVAAMLGVLENVRPRHPQAAPARGPEPVEAEQAAEDAALADETAPEPAEDAQGAAFDLEPADATAEVAPVVDDMPTEVTTTVLEEEEVVGVRHGKEVLEALGILPETCEIEYVAPQVREVTVRRVVNPAAQSDSDLTLAAPMPALSDEPTYEEPTALEVVPRAPQPKPWQVLLDKIREFLAAKPWEALIARLRRAPQAAQEPAPAAMAPEPADEPEAHDEAAQADSQPTAKTAPLEIPSQGAAIPTEDVPAAAETAEAPAAPAAEQPSPYLSLVMDDDPRGVGPKDSSGLSNYDDSFDPEATTPAATERPEAPSDPEWGKSSYRPQLSSVARRATLFDLPDPSAVESDPLGGDAGMTRVQRPQAAQPAQRPSGDSLGGAVAPEPVSTMGSEDGDERRKRARLTNFLDRLKKSDEDEEGGSGWLGDDGDGPRNWRGGAAVRGGLRLVDGDEGQPTEEELRDAVLALGDDNLIAHDIWFVALGASSIDHAGMKAFLAQHRSDIRGCFVVNLDCIGAGELSILSHEGLDGTRRADRRLFRLLSGVANDLHVSLAQRKFDWRSTDATPAMRSSRRSATIMGVDENGLPALSRTPLDLPENVSARQAADVAEIVTEMIRRS